MADITSNESEHTVTSPARVTALIAVWVFGFLILRVFAVSGYDWHTAFLVTTTLGLDDGASLLFGSLMAEYLLTSVLLIVVLPLILAAGVWGPKNYRPVLVLLSALATVLMIALTISFHIWWLPPATVVVFALFALARRLPKLNRVRHAATLSVESVGWVAPLSLLVVAALVQTPWVPHEKIETTTETVSGYVLSVDSGYLNVLTDERKFMILISSDVLSRE